MGLPFARNSPHFTVETSTRSVENASRLLVLFSENSCIE